MDKILKEIRRLYVEKKLPVEEIAEIFEWKTNASVYRRLKKIEDDEIRNEKFRRRSEGHKGIPISEERKVEIGNFFRGKNLTKEHSEKIAKALTGKKYTEERKNKISLALQGRIMPQKQRDDISERLKGRKFSKETEKKRSASLRKYYQENPKARERLLENLNRGCKKSLENKGLNSLEKIVSDELIRRKIYFEHDKPIEQYFVDFYLPSYNLVIECDGGWHNEKEVIEHDLIRDSRIRMLGYTIIRLPRKIIKPNNMPKIIDSILNGGDG